MSKSNSIERFEVVRVVGVCLAAGAGCSKSG